MKKKHKIILIITAIIILTALCNYFIVNFWAGSMFPSVKEIWNAKNRHMLSEFISPDSTYKIGWYNYDEGAMGYTTGNLSIVPINIEYPIQGNLLKTDATIEVNWINNKSVEAIIHNTSTNQILYPKTIKYNDITIQLIIG